MSTAPSQNTGMAKNKKAKNVEMLSNAPYWRIALPTPTATPTITETTVAAITRRRVTGMASPSRVVTARPLSVEVPISPVNRSPSHLPYRSMRGLSRPRLASSRSTCSIAAGLGEEEDALLGDGVHRGDQQEHHQCGEEQDGNRYQQLARRVAEHWPRRYRYCPLAGRRG